MRPGVGVYAAAFLSMLGASAMAVAVPQWLLRLGASPEQAALLLTAYPAAWTLTQLASGPLADRVGRRRVASAGLLAYSGCSVLVWLSPDPAWAASFRMAQGIGLGMFGPAVLGMTVEAGEAAESMALLRSSQVLAMVLGPALGGLLMEALEPLPFLLAAASPLLAALALPEAPPRPSSREGGPSLPMRAEFLLTLASALLAEVVFASMEVLVPVRSSSEGWGPGAAGLILSLIHI